MLLRRRYNCRLTTYHHHQGSGYTVKENKVTVEFSPAFTTEPKVDVATKGVYVNVRTPNGNDEWGFEAKAKDVSTTGFEAVLSSLDATMLKQSAVWIACGEVDA